MDIEKLKKYIADSKFCSETEKCTVACATNDLTCASFCESLKDAWIRLDDNQRKVVDEYRNELGLPLISR